MEWDGMIPGGWIRLPSHITRLIVFLLAFPDCCHFVSLSLWEWVPKWIISVLFDSCAQHVFGGGYYLEMVVLVHDSKAGLMLYSDEGLLCHGKLCSSCDCCYPFDCVLHLFLFAKDKLICALDTGQYC